MSPVEIETMLEGVLVAVGWGPLGEVLDISLMSHDETEYRIDRSTAGDHRLLDSLRKRVRLAVVLQGDRVLRVNRVEDAGDAERS